MIQSNVSSALTAAFSNSRFSERVNCTKLRKSAVTQIHGTHPDKRADLASHMRHRFTTAEKHYWMLEKSQHCCMHTASLWSFHSARPCFCCWYWANRTQQLQRPSSVFYYGCWLSAAVSQTGFVEYGKQRCRFQEVCIFCAKRKDPYRRNQIYCVRWSTSS